MIKTNSNFKIKRPYKTIAATIVDPVQRGHFIRMMIDAQIAEETEKKKPMKSKDD